MLRILDRYILREAAQTWVTVTGVLLVILLSNQFARVLGDAAKDKIAKDAVFSVIGLTALQYLTILVPFGLFLAIMLALARFYRDSELPAMMACRVGPGGLYRPLSLLALPLAGFVAWLAMVVAPDALRSVEFIGAEARRQVDLTSLEPGRFMQLGGDEAVILAEEVSAGGALRNVFLQRRIADTLEIVVAERGTQRQSEDAELRFIVLFNGRRYEGVPGTSAFRIIEFQEYGVPYQLPASRAPDLEPEALPTATLLAAADPLAIAELQWRVSVPLSTLLLAFLAVPLSRSQPRQGRYGKLVLGILIYIIYFNLLGAAKVWVERGEVSPQVGIWWVHALLLALALLLLGWQNGVHRRLFRRRAS